MDSVFTPTNARKNLYNLLKQVNDTHVPVTISSSKNEDAVLISKADWDSLQETMYLENAGVGKIVRKREKDNSGFTNIDEIDWDKL
ncbi:type II toxin-antitoxin system Phd/YefM family antitoxin [uncultured Limosilactobacillus sp.]|uniref:type II toxin-antitoxin system Phd/YefM family antitoxin n=1 Tax=uncultured Limosilactobacillus sp. TaxID=2837629 RepID=UPI0025D8F01C|nr:type II toxin-antitoxin system Phd/YefM family antitoxin [uncultured Limosilactobacillus sp.]